MRNDLSARLAPPTGRVDAVLDTDTFNEIDDQFALAYMLRSNERICTKAIYAAPFFNDRSTDPADGMRKSYAEIQTLLTLAERTDLLPFSFEGAQSYLADEQTPVDSPAARDLVQRAQAYTADNPLYVVAIAAITNIASALLLDPSIAEKIVIVWLGGHAQEWPDTREFNMTQDIAAARVVFDSGAAVVQLPCMGVVDRFSISEPELRHWLLGRSALCSHLAQATLEAANAYAEGTPWTRVIWDVTAVAYLLNTDDRFMESRLIPSPVCGYDDHYTIDVSRHPIRYVWCIKRDALMKDLIDKLTA